MNIKEFNAHGDGIHDDHKAIQAAMDAGHPTVHIPAGRYKIGSTLRVPSNTHLIVSPEAQLFLADDAGEDTQSYLIANADPADGNANIHIEGGIWDGNALNNPRGEDKPGSYTGAILDFCKVSDFSLKQMTFTDAESYYTRLSEVSDFEIIDIRFKAETIRPNQDGIHIAGNSKNGLIRNITGVGMATNDDLVTISADDSISRAQNLGLACGPIDNMTIENLEAESCHTFVRILSVHHPVSNVTVKNVKGGCRCMALNLDGCRECRVLLFDSDDPKYDDGVGDISNLRISNFKVHKSSHDDNTPLINIRTNLDDFMIEEFERDSSRDLNLSAPTVRFSDCRPSRIKLAGLSDSQPISVEGCRGDFKEAQQEFILNQKGKFKLAHGGFSSLSIDPNDTP